jgi:FAD synthase
MVMSVGWNPFYNNTEKSAVSYYTFFLNNIINNMCYLIGGSYNSQF